MKAASHDKYAEWFKSRFYLKPENHVFEESLYCLEDYESGDPVCNYIAFFDNNKDDIFGTEFEEYRRGHRWSDVIRMSFTCPEVHRIPDVYSPGCNTYLFIMQVCHAKLHQNLSDCSYVITSLWDRTKKDPDRRDRPEGFQKYMEFIYTSNQSPFRKYTKHFNLIYDDNGTPIALGMDIGDLLEEAGINATALMTIASRAYYEDHMFLSANTFLFLRDRYKDKFPDWFYFFMAGVTQVETMSEEPYLVAYQDLSAHSFACSSTIDPSVIKTGELNRYSEGFSACLCSEDISNAYAKASWNDPDNMYKSNIWFDRLVQLVSKINLDKDSDQFEEVRKYSSFASYYITQEQKKMYLRQANMKNSVTITDVDKVIGKMFEIIDHFANTKELL